MKSAPFYAMAVALLPVWLLSAPAIPLSDNSAFKSASAFAALKGPFERSVSFYVNGHYGKILSRSFTDWTSAQWACQLELVVSGECPEQAKLFEFRGGMTAALDLNGKAWTSSKDSAHSEAYQWKQAAGGAVVVGRATDHWEDAWLTGLWLVWNAPDDKCGFHWQMMALSPSSRAGARTELYLNRANDRVLELNLDEPHPDFPNKLKGTVIRIAGLKITESVPIDRASLAADGYVDPVEWVGLEDKPTPVTPAPEIKP